MALIPFRDLPPRFDPKGGSPTRSFQTPAGGISFREYVEMRFKALEKLNESDRAELERRLADLNKLREEVVSDRLAFITKDTYTGTETARSLWRETYEAELKAISDRILIIETRSVTWTAALGIFFTGLQVCIGVLVYWLAHK